MRSPAQRSNRLGRFFQQIAAKRLLVAGHDRLTPRRMRKNSHTLRLYTTSPLGSSSGGSRSLPWTAPRPPGTVGQITRPANRWTEAILTTLGDEWGGADGAGSREAGRKPGPG